MNDNLPTQIVREIISDLLIERSIYLENSLQTLAQTNKIDNRDSDKIKIAIDNARNLAIKIRQTIIPLIEALDYLTLDEQKDAQIRCQNYLMLNQNKPSFLK